MQCLTVQLKRGWTIKKVLVMPWISSEEVRDKEVVPLNTQNTNDVSKADNNLQNQKTAAWLRGKQIAHSRALSRSLTSAGRNRFARNGVV